MKAKNITNSGAIRPRYSRVGVSGLFVDLGTVGDYSDTGTHQTFHSDGTSASSSSFNWNNFLNSLVGLGDTFVSSYWNNGAQQQANYTNELYKQEQRTNTILWVVLGIILALGVYLVVRKTK